MRNLAILSLALLLSFATFGALASAASGFPCDFVHVARPKAPTCQPGTRPLLSAAQGGLSRS